MCWTITPRSCSLGAYRILLVGFRQFAMLCAGGVANLTSVTFFQLISIVHAYVRSWCRKTSTLRTRCLLHRPTPVMLCWLNVLNVFRSKTCLAGPVVFAEGKKQSFSAPTAVHTERCESQTLHRSQPTFWIRFELPPTVGNAPKILHLPKD